MEWRRNKPIKINGLQVFPPVTRNEVQDTIKGLHTDGYDYFLVVPGKGRSRKATIWYGRTERESPTRH
jgi:hypothetical protein